VSEASRTNERKKNGAHPRNDEETETDDVALLPSHSHGHLSQTSEENVGGLET